MTAWIIRLWRRWRRCQSPRETPIHFSPVIVLSVFFVLVCVLSFDCKRATQTSTCLGYRCIRYGRFVIRIEQGAKGGQKGWRKIMEFCMGFNTRNRSGRGA